MTLLYDLIYCTNNSKCSMFAPLPLSLSSCFPCSFYLASPEELRDPRHKTRAILEDLKYRSRANTCESSLSCENKVRYHSMQHVSHHLQIARLELSMYNRMGDMSMVAAISTKLADMATYQQKFLTYHDLGTIHCSYGKLIVFIGDSWYNLANAEPPNNFSKVAWRKKCYNHALRYFQEKPQSYLNDESRTAIRIATLLMGWQDGEKHLVTAVSPSAWRLPPAYVVVSFINLTIF